MKKILGVILGTLACVVALTSCNKKETVLIYATSEEERIAYIQEKLDAKFPNYNIVIQYSGTGALVSKLQGEGSKTDCDIVYELEANNMELLLKQDENFFASLDDYDFSQFTDAATSYGHKKYMPTVMTYGSVVINKKVLADNGLTAPTTYEDLLKPAYKNLIEMPNPKSSGTGYLFYNGVVSHYTELLGDEAQGLTAANEYFAELSKNIKEFTSSGSAPIKAANRGEIAIGLAMQWQCVAYKKDNADLDYTSLDFGSPSNLYVRAIINGHEKREAVKAVWDYLYTDINKEDVENFISDPIYKNQTPADPNYPKDVNAINMMGLFDPAYKQKLLDAWRL